jgi:HD-GYP domain-containing protein (c-di-GMP phosphodiesterase class II)
MELDFNAASYATLSSRLQALHDMLLENHPDIERVACALYDSSDDLLKTFINSTRNGDAIRSYQYRLSDSESLSYLARTRELRHLTDIQHTLLPTTAHSRYVLDEGYESSFTVPMQHQGEFLGFIFFDSRRPDTFSPEVRRELVLYANLLTMALANELMAIRSIVGTMQIAREFTEFRNLETGAHLARMARYSRLIARNVAPLADHDDEFVEHVFLYAPLHDIGKIGIPDGVLLKPGPLTDEEWVVMRSHTTKGREIVDRITADLRVDYLPAQVILQNIVEQHHEALDGSGYPYGLAGDEVPLEARIVSVADIFDALTSERPYKEEWSIEDALTELRRMVDVGRLDGRCVEALEADGSELVAIQERHAEPADLPIVVDLTAAVG